MVSTLSPQDEKQSADLHQSSERTEKNEKVSLMEGIRNSVRSRIDTVLGKLSPLPRAYRKVSDVGSSIKRGIQKVFHFFTGSDNSPSAEELQKQFDLPSHDDSEASENASQHSDKPEEIAGLYQDADSAEQAHMDLMGDRFKLMQDNYRRQLSHENDSIPMKNPVLTVDNHLMKEAAIIAKTQANQGFLKHSTDSYRAERNIHGENLFSGFLPDDPSPDFAYQALKGFINSKDTHYQFLAGDFSSVGYAVRYGKDKQTGKKIYFLTVLYGGGQAQQNRPPLIDIPDQEKKAQVLDVQTLDEALKDKPSLQAAFEALKAEIPTDPEMEMSLNIEATQQLQETEITKGLFTITLKKGDKTKLYTVYDRPPLLIRSDSQEVEFYDLLEDFNRVSATDELNETTSDSEETREQ